MGLLGGLLGKSPKINTWYHGTPFAVNNLDPKKAGLRGEYFDDVTFFSSSPRIASGYAVDLKSNEQFSGLLDKIGKARQDYNTSIIDHGMNAKQTLELESEYLDLERQRAQLYDQINKFQQPTTGSNVIPAELQGNMLEIDAKGKHYSETHREAIERARKEGYDGVIIRNSLDPSSVETQELSDIAAVFNKESILPKFRSGIIPTSATGLMGISALSQGQDALLSPAESAYLKEQDKVSGLLGVKDTGAYNYSDILPTKRHKETGDYSFAMTGLLEDAVRALADIGQSSKTGVVKPTSFWDL